jgi:spermidine synthase
MVLILLGAVLFSRPSIDSFDTQYDRYFIRRGTDSQSGRPVVALALDVRNGAETIVYADNGDPFTSGYSQYYDLALKLAPQVKRTLLIGGGAFAYPRHQFALFPNSSTDVVEIDPKLVTVARQDFFLKDDPRQNIIVEDGRTFLDHSQERYDVVLLDAFKSRNSVPYQLTTRESMQLCYDRLGPRGVLAMNLIASIDGPGHKFLQAEYATLKMVFPRVVVFAVADPSNPSVIQNFSLMGFKDASDGSVAALKAAYPELAVTRLDGYSVPKGTRILTDDFAPVDQYIIDL